MALTLTISDTADGTGGTATIGGTTGSSVNTLYRASWDGTMQSYTWTLHGSRTGNGTIAIASPSPVALGFYLWQVVRVDGATVEVGPVVYQNISSTALPIHRRCLDAIKTGITSLNLAGSVGITQKWIPRTIKDVDTLPACIISPLGVESYLGGLNNKDDIGYPCLIVWIDAQNQDPLANMSRNMLWRQRVSKLFREQRLSGVPEVYTSKIEYQTVVSPSEWYSNYYVGMMTIRPISRETRGLS